MMTKKHFIKIAEVLGNQNKVDIQLVNELMDLFETFNTNFNRNIFLKKVVDCKKICISEKDKLLINDAPNGRPFKGFKKDNKKPFDRYDYPNSFGSKYKN
tara:strand:- start:299 stop:598 length:300 start_codon:yes stop_codon:yes gene_type:complete